MWLRIGTDVSSYKCDNGLTRSVYTRNFVDYLNVLSGSEEGLCMLCVISYYLFNSNISPQWQELKLTCVLTIFIVWVDLPHIWTPPFWADYSKFGCVPTSLQWNTVLGCDRAVSHTQSQQTCADSEEIHQISFLVSKHN